MKLTLGLCRERTVNYSPKDYSGDGPDGMPAPGMESRVTAILASHLEKWEVNYEIHAKTRGRDNLLAWVGRGDPSYRTIFLLSRSRRGDRGFAVGQLHGPARCACPCRRESKALE